MRYRMTVHELDAGLQFTLESGNASQTEVVGRWIAKVQDKAITERLVAMGWTPPDAQDGPPVQAKAQPVADGTIHDDGYITWNPKKHGFGHRPKGLSLPTDFYLASPSVQAEQPRDVDGLVAAVAVKDNREVAMLFDTPEQANAFVRAVKVSQPAQGGQHDGQPAPANQGLPRTVAGRDRRDERDQDDGGQSRGAGGQTASAGGAGSAVGEHRRDGLAEGADGPDAGRGTADVLLTAGRPVAEQAAQQGEPPLKAMTPGRAEYFMERFLREEKMLGPNEQASLRYVIAMLQRVQQGEPSDEAIQRHQIRAGDCPPDSMVLLVSSVRRLQSRAVQSLKPATLQPLSADQYGPLAVAAEQEADRLSSWGPRGHEWERMRDEALIRAVERAHGIQAAPQQGGRDAD